MVFKPNINYSKREESGVNAPTFRKITVTLVVKGINNINNFLHKIILFQVKELQVKQLLLQTGLSILLLSTPNS